MRFRPNVAVLLEAFVEKEGALAGAQRRELLERAPEEVELGTVPSALAAYAHKVARQAHEVTDEDVGALFAAGYSSEQIFEATVGAALGAAKVGLAAGLAALRGEHR